MNTQVLDKIKEFVKEKYTNSSGQHDYRHLQKVASNALLISKTINHKPVVDDNLLVAICYLHDLAILKNKRNLFLSLYDHIFERSINKNRFHNLFPEINLSVSEYGILANAILNHSYSIPYRRLNIKKDIYSKILQDADSIDYVSKERLSNFNKHKWFLAPVSQIYIYLIRKNLKYFLNFPQLANKLNLFEN